MSDPNTFELKLYAEGEVTKGHAEQSQEEEKD